MNIDKNKVIKYIEINDDKLEYYKYSDQPYSKNEEAPPHNTTPDTAGSQNTDRSISNTEKNSNILNKELSISEKKSLFENAKNIVTNYDKFSDNTIENISNFFHGLNKEFH